MSQHQEFPELTQQAQAAYRAGCRAGPFSPTPLQNIDRRYLAAFLREAMEQATEHGCVLVASDLQAIADNLHSPPPTLAEAREAARQLAGPSAEVVRDFLATLGEGGQA